MKSSKKIAFWNRTQIHLTSNTLIYVVELLEFPNFLDETI